MKSRPSKIDAAVESLLADLGSDASRRGYRSDWTFFTKWLKRKKIAVLKVTPKVIKAYVVHLADKGQAQRTRGRALSVIRAVYGALVADELLKYNPAREVKNTKRGRSEKPVTWLEEDALKKFLAFGAPLRGQAAMKAFLHGMGDGSRCDSIHNMPSCGSECHVEYGTPNWTDRRDRMCIQLLAGTGRRRAEVAHMRVEDFTDEGVTGVVKGGAVKTAPVPDWLRRELADWTAFAGIKSGPVLPRSPEDAESIAPFTVWAIVKRVAAAVGVDPKKVSTKLLGESLRKQLTRATHDAIIREWQPSPPPPPSAVASSPPLPTARSSA